MQIILWEEEEEKKEIWLNSIYIYITTHLSFAWVKGLMSNIEIFFVLLCLLDFSSIPQNSLFEFISAKSDVWFSRLE